MRKLSDKKRLVILICIFAAFAMIIASAGVLSKWLIVPTVSAEPTYIVDKDNCDYFTDTAVFNGQDNVPKLKPEWEAVFGGTEFEITWTGGNYYFNSADTSGHYKVGIADGDHDYGAYAGNHFYKIVDKLTGQVLSENHELIVEQADVSIGTLDVQVGFASDTVSWTEVPLIGVGGESVYTLTINKTKTLTATDYGTDGAYAASTATGTTGVLGGNYVAANQHLGGDYARCNYKVPATFDADNDGDYDGLEYSLPFVVLPMCYSTKNTRTYYGDISTALADASSGDTVYAMQSFTADGEAYTSMVDYHHMVSDNITIDEGVTLNVAFCAEGEEGYAEGIRKTHSTDINAFGNAKYIKNRIEIGGTLTNNGTLVIGGTISGGGGGKTNNSIVADNYAEVLLGENGKIIQSKSEAGILCYGSIVEKTEDSEVDVEIQNGSIEVIFSIVEHRGGSIFAGMYSNLKAPPFNRFFVQSVAADMSVSSTSEMTGKAILYATQNMDTEISLIGKSSDAFVKLSDGAEAIIGYKVSEKKNYLDVYGSSDINPITVKISNNSMSTKDVLLPLSYLWNIEFHPFSDGSYAELRSTDQDIKIMPGCTVIIHKGVTATMRNVAVYEDNSLVGVTDPGMSYSVSTPGRLVVNGTLNVQDLGGTVQTENPTAILVISGAVSVTAMEVKSHSGASFLTTVTYGSSTLAAKLPVYNYDNVNGTISNISSGTYYSAGTSWHTNDSRYEVKYIFCYEDGTLASELSATSTSYTRGGNLALSIPQTFPDGYTFDSWYWDADMTELINGATGEDTYAKGAADHSITVYGKLKPVVAGEITVNFQQYNTAFTPPVMPDSITITLQNGVETVDLTEQLSAYESNAISYFNNNLEEKYYFIGWCNASGEAIDISSVDLTTAVNSQINIYVNWEEKYSVTISPQSGDNNGETPTITVYMSYDQTSNVSAAVNTVSDITKETVLYVAPNQYIRVTASNAASSNQDGTYYDKWGAVADNITIVVKGKAGESCFVEGTLITLADGSVKPVEEITYEDLVLIFNHETGRIEPGYVLFTSHKDDDRDSHAVINLVFSDGRVLRIVEEHAVFDLDLNRYVYITEENAGDFIGHRFYTTDYVDGSFVAGEVVLTDSYVTVEQVRIFCPVTAYHMNSFAEGLLTMPNMPQRIHGMINIFEYDADLKYNEEQMRADIEKYGIYTYEDFADRISLEAYLASPAKYLKVAIGKGMLTLEEIEIILDYLLSGGLIN